MANSKKSGRESIVDILYPGRKAKEDYHTGQWRTTAILPVKCDICGIGIGMSMQKNYRGEYEPYKHMNQIVYRYKWSGGVVRVDKDCLERIKRAKDPEAFIKEQIGAE